jgi:hypothetical protein
MCYCTSGTSGGAVLIHFATSLDGENWTVKTDPILSPEAGNWDNSNLYRASGIMLERGHSLVYGLYYSAMSSGSEWRTGYTEVNLGIVSQYAGYLGIGTAKPYYSLEIMNTGAGTETIPLMLHNNNSTNGTGVSLGFSGVSGNILTGKILNTRVGSGDYRTDFYNYTSSLGVVMSLYNSRVGIGTTAPGSKLDVHGTIEGQSLLIKNISGDQYNYLESPT